MLVTFIAIVAIVLASCGSPAAGRTNQASPVPTITVVPSNTPTTAPALTPTSTPKPTTSPQATVTPTQPAAPAILDVRPSSMSIVGHLDCNRASSYVCLARVLSRADAQSDLHWTAFTNVPGNIGFSPASGVLAPGQSVLITITIPFNACTPGLFFFRGPVNTHTITWAC
ncbi:MAG: hypothetical protein E6I93_02665 [Chloroflexi bacterium]|nr:MAG: hypothetical protein E6I93_02665 [Chloroflexota bacterium]